MMVQEYIKKYIKDMKYCAMNNSNILGLIGCVKKLRNYVECMPYLSKILTVPT